MLSTPATIDEAVQCVRQHSRVQIVGAGTKSALTQPIDRLERLCTKSLAGVTEYESGEFLVTVLAGTTLETLDSVLAAEGQYLPFDPPLLKRGATIGGTISANLSGSGRLKYGGLRDFLMGVRLVDGRGHLVTGGGHVVKNSAGYDLPKLVAGCCGSLALLVEVTLKVLPRPTHTLALRRTMESLAESMKLCAELSRSPLDITALDISPSGVVDVLLAGSESANVATKDRLIRSTDSSWQIVDHEYWSMIAEWSDVEAGERLTRVPLAPSQVTGLDAAMHELRVPRRYSVAGNVAWIRWPAPQPIRTLDETLLHQHLGGTILTGTAARCRLGRRPEPELMARLKRAFDPDNRFASS